MLAPSARLEARLLEEGAQGGAESGEAGNESGVNENHRQRLAAVRGRLLRAEQELREINVELAALAQDIMRCDDDNGRGWDEDATRALR